MTVTRWPDTPVRRNWDGVGGEELAAAADGAGGDQHHAGFGFSIGYTIHGSGAVVVRCLSLFRTVRIVSAHVHFRSLSLVWPTARCRFAKQL